MAAGKPVRTGVLVAAMLVAGVLTASWPSPAQAVPGDTVATITPDLIGTQCGADITLNRGGPAGVAFDGSTLLVACGDAITQVSVADGHQIANHPIAGFGSKGIGTLAWDAGRNKVWACNGFEVVLIDLSTNTYAPQFSTSSCLGLAYDATDDTIWNATGVGSVQHYTAAGGLISSTNTGRLVSGASGDCGVSGAVATGSGGLYIGNYANFECDAMYVVDKAMTASVVVKYPAHGDADMECDDVTFAASGKTVLWTVNSNTRTISAMEIPPGRCSVGAAAPLKLDPAVANTPTGSQHTVTATVRDGAAPVLGAHVHFSVSGVNPSSGAGTTNSSGQASFAYVGTHHGVDTVTACRDANNNNSCDSGEPVESAISEFIGTEAQTCGTPGTFRVSIGDATVMEGDSGGPRTMKFPVTLSGPSASEVDVTYTLRVGSTFKRQALTAVYPQDVGSPQPARAKLMRFKPSPATGLTSRVKFVTVRINPDENPESMETFTVELSNPVGASLGRSVGIGTILDDDGDGSGQHVGIGSGRVCEGDDTAMGNKLPITVSLGNPSPVLQIVTVNVADLTATSLSDYKAPRNPIQVKIRPGKVQAVVTLTTKSDTVGPPSDVAAEDISLTVVAAAVPIDPLFATSHPSILDDDHDNVPVF